MHDYPRPFVNCVYMWLYSLQNPHNMKVLQFIIVNLLPHCYWTASIEVQITKDVSEKTLRLTG